MQIKVKACEKSWLPVCTKDKNTFILMYSISIVISIAFTPKNDQDKTSDSMKELWPNSL